MDVELLRPGTVPISPETILWFEFLLSEDLLLNHLKKSNPDPAPVDLTIKFYSVIFGSANKLDTKKIEENGEVKTPDINSDFCYPKQSSKNIALKILCLKVAAFGGWNLDQIIALPFRVQMDLMQNLLYFTSDKKELVDIPNVPDANVESAFPCYLFAIILYHSWVLSISVNNSTNNTAFKGYCMDITVPEEDVVYSPENVQKSIKFLKEVLNWTKTPKMPVFECFIMLTENDLEVKNDWEKAKMIPKDEISAQINYNLAVYYFHNGNYEAAALHFTNTAHCLKNCSDFVFANIDRENLKGYLLACNAQIEDTKPCLMQQFYNCIANQYTGIFNILQQDNLTREISLVHRISLELDVQGALSSGKFTAARDFLPRIQALNCVRCLFDKKTTCRYNFNSDTIDLFIKAVTPTINACIDKDKLIIKQYLIKLILNQKENKLFNKIRSDSTLRSLFSNIELQNLNQEVVDAVHVPHTLHGKDLEIVKLYTKRNPSLDIKVLEKQLMLTYDPSVLKELLVKYCTKNSNKPVWKINPCWELPIPLQSVLVTMPKGFLQDYSFIMLAKAREMMLSKDWSTSVEYLNIVANEIQKETGNAVPKLLRLIEWEILLVKINQLMDQWPAPDMDKNELAQACEACLQTSESILPRTEIIEYCAVCLLNLTKWDFLSSFEKRWSYSEIASAIMTACQDLEKYKGFKKVAKDLWEIVLPAFSSAPLQTKRSSSGNATVIHRDSPQSNSKATLMSFLPHIRDSTIFTIIISLLARLYNILRDETSLELHTDYLPLWPAVVSNANSYSTKNVCEVLSQVLTQALYYYPMNVPWLRLMGDINYANSHHEAALSYYLKSLVIASDHFNIPIRNDDLVIKRMIKTCSTLNCHTQASVLCQFLDEPDYMFAFRNLAEQKVCYDAADAYYLCFWDMSMLELLVHVHHKRGEFQRRKRAIQVMGLLELNANNNEEIKREASNLRKSVFLRAMCKQYLQ
ncbi:integrator complex subunit 8 [Agrilus planipennis]|uniref:Integrator complex subunit 8 n=1 Tax=Agrilus planipennis TaxID=224129 RepID=A0A7F5RA49_AGRPL|nr:integrator complex subunit 8 [Agrilus planipennis]XP_025832849.1 integrator complex subunit 8 [Agrilus planipennis]XP_025832850.1 integrator complex subunit 8 [Agrilus planipennis]XP_025832851.1 integrator complex subunit 8 [Agrilus planipennis]XP_025832852.1 integrator complex subunit 8 [Agrilus planipennis]